MTVRRIDGTEGSLGTAAHAASESPLPVVPMRHLPGRYDEIANTFRHPGAYARFKWILESAGRLDAWYAFEANETERALREWCEENGLRTTSRGLTPP